MVFTAIIKFEFQFDCSCVKINTTNGKCSMHKNNVTIICNDASGCNKIYEIGSSSVIGECLAKIYIYTHTYLKTTMASAVRAARWRMPKWWLHLDRTVCIIWITVCPYFFVHHDLVFICYSTRVCFYICDRCQFMSSIYKTSWTEWGPVCENLISQVCFTQRQFQFNNYKLWFTNTKR